MTRLRMRARAVAVLLSALLVVIGIPASPAYAAEQYVGGASEYPMYVLNDHTPIAIRFSAETTPTGLEPLTQYYVKARFTVGTSPSSATNRGFTWNPTSKLWVSQNDDWTSFPTITTDAEGRITVTADAWVYAKFGDELNSGDYYLMVSLSKTGAASTYNPASPPLITVLDAASEGSWIHNGATLPTNEDTRLAVRGPDPVSDQKTSTSPIYSLWRTERNLVDDDGDGAIDGAAEDWGILDPVNFGANDFRTGVPAETTATVFIKRSLKYGGPIVTAPADCDMALGADDEVPPSAVSDLAAATSSDRVDLSWDAATDDGGSGLAGYRVYRWDTIDPTVAPPFTPAASLVATTAPGVTTFVDTDVVRGSSSSYYERAVDADTNAGPRSNTVDAAVVGANELSRDSGDDRYATALDISQKTFADGSAQTVVLATGAAFPDALAASGLAGAYGSPLLLVGSVVTDDLMSELDRLGATTVVLVGGEMAISADVADALDVDHDIDRVSGMDRYETAAAVAREIVDLGGVSTAAYFVRGDDFADALSVSPFAYATKTPVLLVSTAGVPSATSGAIDELGITTGMIAGGISAVSEDAAADLEALLGSLPVRWSGADRYETAAAVAQAHVNNMVASYAYVGIATGRNFADALGGGAAAGANGGVLLLTQPDSLSAPTQAILETNELLIDEVHVFGGEVAVADIVYQQIDAILQ